jgi:hypothetical protein
MVQDLSRYFFNGWNFPSLSGRMPAAGYHKIMLPEESVLLRGILAGFSAGGEVPGIF